MKKPLHFKLVLTALLHFFVTATICAQSYEAAKTLSKSAAVPEGITINISNHSGHIKLTATNENTVSIHTEIKVNAKSKEEADKLIKAVESFTFEQRGDVLEVNTRFYKNMQSINGRTTLTLENGNKIRIKDFEIRHELNIPKTANLNLKNKYSDVYLETFDGKANLNLYSSKLTADDFMQEVSIESKYSKLQIKNFNAPAKLNLYDTDIKFNASNDIEITSKYSKIEAGKTGKLEAESYDDKFYVGELSSLKMNAKYSDFKTEDNVTDLHLGLYDCNVTTGSVQTIVFNGKYSDLELGDVNTLKVNESYDNNINFGKTQIIEFGKSKYSKYILEGNTSFAINESYDDMVEIKKLNPGFSGIKLNGRYSKLNIEAAGVPFKVDVKMKYGKVELPETIKILKHIEKSGELEILGGESGGLIQVTGYDNTLIIE